MSLSISEILAPLSRSSSKRSLFSEASGTHEEETVEDFESRFRSIKKKVRFSGM